jgi:hypothetical protein
MSESHPTPDDLDAEAERHRKANERTIRYRARHPERVAAARERSYEKHRAKYLEQRARKYRENREAELAKSAARYRRNHEYLDGLKRESGCVRCGERHPDCLEFHHRDGEPVKRVSCRCQGGWKALLAEVEKCDILCANCHRKADAEIAARKARGPKQRNVVGAQSFLEAVKAIAGCFVCGERCVVCLEFHHDLADWKAANVPCLVTKDLSTIVAELLKCSVLCANCHRKTHAPERRMPADQRRRRKRAP